MQGRGGIEELGATFWGQTELSCYDDSMHGGFCLQELVVATEKTQGST
jgi:hypothetical protein